MNNHIDNSTANQMTKNASITSQSNRINSKKPFNFSASTYTIKQSNRASYNGYVNDANNSGTYRNHIRRSLGGQLRPKQTIEVLTFTNHTRCGCVIRS